MERFVITASRQQLANNSQHEVLYGEDDEVFSRCLEKDDERGVPYGITYRLERAMAAPPAAGSGSPDSELNF